MGAVSGVAAAITAWQSESGASRKINRYTNAVVALQNHLMWWNGLTSVEQNSQANINRLVVGTEFVKMTEVNAWADASRQQEQADGTASELAAQGSVETANPVAANDYA